MVHDLKLIDSILSLLLPRPRIRHKSWWFNVPILSRRHPNHDSQAVLVQLIVLYLLGLHRKNCGAVYINTLQKRRINLRVPVKRGGVPAQHHRNQKSPTQTPPHWPPTHHVPSIQVHHFSSQLFRVRQKNHSNHHEIFQQHSLKTTKNALNELRVCSYSI